MKSKISTLNKQFIKSSDPLTSEQLAEIEALRKLPNDQINTGAPGAPGAHVMPYDPNRKRGNLKQLFRPIKSSISLRLDADVIEWFRQSGEGYQTRMNAALRSYMESKPGRR